MSTEDRFNPKYRPFRVTAYVVHIVISFVLALAVMVGVYKSIEKMTPRRPHLSEVAMDVASCERLGADLWNQLEAQRKALTESKDVKRADHRWTYFREDWEVLLANGEARCSVDEPGRERVKKLFQLLDDAMDLYTTHAVQFSGEVGPTVDKLKATLQELEKK